MFVLYHMLFAAHIHAVINIMHPYPHPAIANAIIELLLLLLVVMLIT